MGGTGRGKFKEVGTYKGAVFTSEISGNAADLCPVGALTHAPQSFRFRPWELIMHNSIDIMDSLCTPIEVYTRGAEIMRIFPRVNETINDEWLSDKGRQAFDGLRIQRLTSPLRRRPNGEYEEISWEKLMEILKTEIGKVDGEEMRGIVGPFANVESVVAFRDLMHRLGCERLHYKSLSEEIPHDFRAQYLLGSSIRGVDFADVLVLVGFNPRSLSPILNARIRKAIVQRGLKVAMIGSGDNLFYKYLHLGTSTKTIREIAQKTHPYSKILGNAKFPMIMVNSDSLRRADGPEIMQAIYKICKEYKVLNPQNKWNGLNILPQNSEEAGIYDIGLSSELTEEEKKAPCKLVYSLGADDCINDIPQDAFLIYQVAHFLFNKHRDFTEIVEQIEQIW
jgi:NADH dehydrogenase (ubiquinone) Fe-S protein 1